MTPKQLRDARKDFDRIKFWCNRTNDAWSMGEAEWSKERGRCNRDLLSGVASYMLDEGQPVSAVADAIESIAKLRGIDPKRHRWRPAQ